MGEGVFGIPRLKRGAQHHDHLRRGGQRAPQQRSVPIVKGLKAAYEDGHLKS
jgi:hypothetical protein